MRADRFACVLASSVFPAPVWLYRSGFGDVVNLPVRAGPVADAAELLVVLLLGEHDQIAGWVVLVFDDIDGRHPGLSPGSPDIGHVVAMTAALGPVLTPCPVASAPTASAELAGLVHGWTELAAAPPHDLDPWTRRHLARLASLETGWLAAADGDTLLHGDINASNLLITTDGKTWLVDWAQPVRGAAWIDVADLIPHLILAGHTPAQAEHALAAVPAWAATPPETITSYAAAFAGYWAWSSRLPGPPGVPSLRAYQARAAQAAIAWTAYRTGWPRAREHAPPDK